MAAVPPAMPGLPLLTAHPYREWYADHARDPFIGNYPAIYANYALTQANTPQVVRNRICSNGNNGTPIGHVLLVRPVNGAAGSPGKVQAYHRTVRFEPGLIGATPFDSVAYAFLGDIQAGHLPPSVVWEGVYFNRTQDIQVPTAAYMDQLLAGDPTLEQVGPYAAGTADTELVNTRISMFIPNRYINLLLEHDGMTPREAWLRIRGAIINDGLAAECEMLLDWFRVALTRRHAGVASPMVQEPPLTQPLTDIRESNIFQKFRGDIVDHDHPNLRTNQVTAGAHMVAQGLTDIATQTRLQRESDEARRLAEAQKTPADLFPTGLPKLLRWCQVASENLLPPIYARAAGAKKGDRRKILQDQVTETLEALGYQHEFPITTKLSQKVFDLEWSSRLVDDFSLGLNLFVMGWVVEEVSEVRKMRNAQADALYGGHAAPSLADATAILETDDTVHIPTTVSQLRYSVELSHAMWHTLLGPNHELVNQHRAYRLALVNKEM